MQQPEISIHPLIGRLPKKYSDKILFASLNKKVNPYKACIYGLCRDFLDGVGYDLGTKQ